MPQPEFILHVWPGKWNLPSIDASCIAAVLYLQLAVPGKFGVAECTNPDLSPSGQLPFLTHGHRPVANLSSIIKYVTGWEASRNATGHHPDLDETLSTSEWSQCIAWTSHVESVLGDLTAYMFFSLSDNWRNLTHPTYASMLPLPQRYYVPERIRDIHRSRLEAAGLWNSLGIEPEAKSTKLEKNTENKNKDGFAKVFQKEKVLEKARSAFNIYTRLLSSKRLFYHDRPTTLDVLLAAHILLLIFSPFPDPLFKSLITTSYPNLETHANLVYSLAFSESTPNIPTVPAQSYSLRSLLPNPRKSTSVKTPEKTAEDIRIDRLRWGWIMFAIAGMVGYVVTTGLTIAIVPLTEEEMATESGTDGNVTSGKDTG